MISVTSEEMKAIDIKSRQRYGIPSIILMENAGRVSAEEAAGHFFKKDGAAVFCGKGNNGGDGFVCARYLRNSGIKANVFLIGRSSEIRNPDPSLNLSILRKLGINITEISSASDLKKLEGNFQYSFIVDAIFGIGFKGDLPELVKDTIILMNKSNKPIFSLDVPSGLDANTGEARGACVKAYKTITFGLPKTGFMKKSAKPFVGKLVVKDIGFPKELLSRQKL